MNDGGCMPEDGGCMMMMNMTRAEEAAKKKAEADKAWQEVLGKVKERWEEAQPKVSAGKMYPKHPQ
eukprot:12422388-Karenia_brevis.AAC.1